METLDQNGEHGRVKTERRRRWATALVRPQTVKTVAAVGRWVVMILKLIYAIVRVFRD